MFHNCDDHTAAYLIIAYLIIIILLIIIKVIFTHSARALTMILLSSSSIYFTLFTL